MLNFEPNFEIQPEGHGFKNLESTLFWGAFIVISQIEAL